MRSSTTRCNVPPPCANLGRTAPSWGPALGLGAVAAAELIGGGSALGKGAPEAATTGPDKGVLRTGQIPARAKRVVQMHMWGAVSQVDTFDYKPTLYQMHGKEIPPSVKNNGARISAMSNGQTSFPICKPLWPVQAVRPERTWASELFRHTGAIADDLTFIHSMHTDARQSRPGRHLPAHRLPAGGPAVGGAWVNYALGTDNANLPSYRGDEVAATSQAGVAADLGAPGARASCPATTRASSSARAPSRCSTSPIRTASASGERRAQLRRDRRHCPSDQYRALGRPRDPVQGQPVRDGLSDAGLGARRSPTSPTSPTTSSTCTGPTCASPAPSPATAFWPAGCSSAG